MSGIFNLINIPFSYVIRFFYSITGNYMVALFGFALVVKLVLFPIGIKSQKNMVKQATLRPRELAIRAKYAGRTDKATQQKMQTEIMELYQKENYNPAGGCLPLIIQLIVVWAIYQIVYGPLTYLCSMSADGVSFLKEAVLSLTPDLKTITSEIQLLNYIDKLGIPAVIEAMTTLGNASAEVIAEAQNILTNSWPNMTVFGMNLAVAPQEVFPNLLIIVPILNLLTTWGSTKITRMLSYQAPSAEDQQAASSMKIMEYAMPLMIMWMSFSLPAALGIYWIFQNLLGVLQQFILSKMYPYPVFTEEDLKAAEREIRGKREKKAPTEYKGTRNPNVRSLHHIDDEDYEPAQKTGTASSGTRYDREDDKHEDKDASEPTPIAPAPLKEDDKK